MSPTLGRRASYGILLIIALGLGTVWMLSKLHRDDHKAPKAARANPTEAANSNAVNPATARLGQKSSPPRDDYVGSNTCAECHPKIARQYASHSMAKSAEEVARAKPVEDFGNKATFTADKHHVYSVQKTSGGIKHRESLIDDLGQTLYDQSESIDFVIGSGVHGKSYLLQRGDALFMSPISWYSKASRWNLSPGYRLPVHRRFERRIVDGCVDCHVGRVNYKRGEDHHFGQPPFHELSIGCERCHGPGGQHVKYHRDSAPAAETDPIINPGKLDPGRREDVCAQCHLQGEGRIPNYGCEMGDYRPGQRLDETLAIFVKGTRTTPDGKSRAVSQVEQMRSSVCYQNSAGTLGCISCHDPHSLPTESNKVTFYREKCLTCHQQPGCTLPGTERLQRQPDDSCVACHMHPIGASDIPHTSHTDHRILRRPSKLQHDSPSEKSLPEMFDHAEERLPQWAVIRARGLWLADRSETSNDRAMAEMALSLLSHVSQQIPDDPEIIDAQGTASAVLGKFDDSIEFWKRTLELAPKRDSTLRTLALTLHNSKRTDEAIPFLKRYLDLQPWNASLWGRYSHILLQRGQLAEALKAANKAKAIDPSMPRVYELLASIYEKLGDEPLSRHYELLYERVRAATAQDSPPAGGTKIGK